MTYSKLFCVAAAMIAWLGMAALPANAAHPYNPQFKPVSQVLDNAGVFRPRTLQDLKAYAEDSEYYTGNQFVIGIVPSFGGKTADAYALEAAQALKVSEQGKPGVLLIVSQKDRDARIVAGSQLAAAFPVAVQQTILDRIILPNLRQGKMEKGVIDGLGAIMMALQGRYTPKQVQMASASTGMRGWSPMAIFGVLILLRVLGFGGRRYGGGSMMGSVLGGVLGAMMMGGARRRW